MTVYLVMCIYHHGYDEDQIMVLGIYDSKDKAESEKQKFLKSKYFLSSHIDYDYTAIYVKEYILNDFTLDMYELGGVSW